MTSSVRCFFAIPVSDSVRNKIVRAVEVMRSRPNGDRVRWVPGANLHVTLRFLGEVSMSTLPDVMAAVGREVAPLSAFECEIGEVHPFPRARNPRVIAAALHSAGQLNELAAAVERGVVTAGQSPDPRGFRAHLTVGRLRGHGHPAVHDESGLVGTVLDVDRIVIMRSDLQPDGAVYSELESVALETAGAHGAG